MAYNPVKFFLIIFIAGTVFEFVLKQFLEFIDFKARKNNGTKVPSQLEGFVDEEKIKQTCEYENAAYRLWVPKNIILTAIDVVTVLLLYKSVFFAMWNWTGNPYWTVLLFMVITSLPGTIAGIPFSLISEFKIEKKFGFSKMTFRMWLLDNLKSLVLSLIVSVPLLLAATALLIHAQGWWWLLLGSIYLLFSLAATYVYPIWISPLFNKFTPLEDGELKARLEALLAKTGFKSSGIFVMDASKRSSHSNAYFTGIGKNKRIVLYDTLIQQLDADEIEAVLAHELGHYKKHHVTKRLVAVVPLIFAVLFTVSILIKVPDLYYSFGAIPENAVAGMTAEESPLQAMVSGSSFSEGTMPFTGAYLFLGLMYLFCAVSGFSPLVNLVENAFSRRDEFQADYFAAELCGSGKPLSTALIKLNKENLSEFTPPAIYSLFNYNHPPLLDRMKHVEKVL